MIIPSVISPTSPASPRLLTSAMMLPVTLPKTASWRRPKAQPRSQARVTSAQFRSMIRSRPSPFATHPCTCSPQLFSAPDYATNNQLLQIAARRLMGGGIPFQVCGRSGVHNFWIARIFSDMPRCSTNGLTFERNAIGSESVLQNRSPRSLRGDPGPLSANNIRRRDAAPSPPGRGRRRSAEYGQASPSFSNDRLQRNPARRARRARSPRGRVRAASTCP
jgi:hypothetical protein